MGCQDQDNCPKASRTKCFKLIRYVNEGEEGHVTGEYGLCMGRGAFFTATQKQLVIDALNKAVKPKE